MAEIMVVNDDNSPAATSFHFYLPLAGFHSAALEVILSPYIIPFHSGRLTSSFHSGATSIYGLKTNTYSPKIPKIISEKNNHPKPTYCGSFFPFLHSAAS